MTDTEIAHANDGIAADCHGFIREAAILTFPETARPRFGITATGHGVLAARRPAATGTAA